MFQALDKSSKQLSDKKISAILIFTLAKAAWDFLEFEK